MQTPAALHFTATEIDVVRDVLKPQAYTPPTSVDYPRTLRVGRFVGFRVGRRNYEKDRFIFGLEIRQSNTRTCLRVITADTNLYT